MSTIESNKSTAGSMATSDNPIPVCPPGTVWNPNTQTCEEASGGLEVSAYSDIEEDAKESAKNE